jgi:hypothetical protein
MLSNIRLQWNSTPPSERFRAGVSLHSHTLHSRESLGFIYHAATRAPLLAATIRHGERRYRKLRGTDLDLSRGWWTPPLGPHDAWSVEKWQIEELDLNAFVSLTDHDNIEAPVSLHVLEECRGVPISVEWTVPFHSTFFHLGIHNLPFATARSLFSEMDEYRKSPRENQLLEILSALAATPEILLVLNHPLWDESGIGQARHWETVRAFLELTGPKIHALELNGLRPWRENREVLAVAADLGKPVISGGDRHAFEPNAMLNLTNAGTFDEFVEEVRSGWSDVLILRHYRETYALRIVHNMIDVLRTYDRHAHGWRLWSDRVFYLCDDGITRSLTELFGERTPAPVAFFVGALQFASAPHIRRLLREAFAAGEEVAL